MCVSFSMYPWFCTFTSIANHRQPKLKFRRFRVSSSKDTIRNVRSSRFLTPEFFVMTTIEPVKHAADNPLKGKTPAVSQFVRPGARESCVRQIGEAEDLNASPTFFITLIVAILTSSASYFVSEYVVDVVRTEAVFLLGCYVTFTSYFMFHYYLNLYSSSYRAVDSGK